MGNFIKITMLGCTVFTQKMKQMIKQRKPSRNARAFDFYKVQS